MINFPKNYPYSPPSVKFLTKVWHPNVYEVRFSPDASLRLTIYQLNLLFSIEKLLTSAYFRAEIFV